VLAGGLDGVLGAEEEGALDSTLNCEFAVWLACRDRSFERLLLVEFCRLVAFWLSASVSRLSAMVGAGETGPGRAWR